MSSRFKALVPSFSIFNIRMRSVDLLIRRPSTSDDNDLHPAFHAAEKRGKRGADCSTHYKDCPSSLLGLLTEQ